MPDKMPDKMPDLDDNEHYLSGHLLMAMPNMQDPRFARTVIYMCAHSAEGAMGLVVNQVLESLSLPDLLEQLGIETAGHGQGDSDPFSEGPSNRAGASSSIPPITSRRRRWSSPATSP